MPICEKKNFIFIHIPKTGGKAIEKKLHIGNNQPLWGLCNKKKYYKQHFTAKDISECIHTYNKYVKFAIVRNPYTRLVSVYVQAKNPRSDSMLVKFIGNATYYEFLCKVEKIIKNKNYTGSYCHFRPMVDFIDDTVDHVIKYENMHKELIDKLGICIDYKKETDYSSYYNDPDAAKMIEKIYAADFKSFKYKNPY